MSRKNTPLLVLALFILSVGLISATDISSCSGGYYQINQSGNYNLVNDLNPCFIQIFLTSHVNLDCQGYTINAGGGDGIIIDGQGGSALTNITINNCIIENGEYGINFREVENSYISNSKFYNNNRAIYLIHSKNVNIFNSELSNNNVAITIQSNPNPPWLFSSELNIFSNNYIYDDWIIQFWDTGESTINYWNTTIGNYWANPSGTGYSQTCEDLDVNGICDLPYVIDANNTDYFPIKDIVFPSIDFISIENKTYLYNEEILLNISASDNYGIKNINYNLNGTNETYTNPINLILASNQSYKLDIFIKDIDNLVSNQTIYFSIDTNNPPIINNFSPNEADILINISGNTEFLINASDLEDILTYNVLLDNISVSTDSNYTLISACGLNENHTLEIQANDGENIASKEWNVQVNTESCPLPPAPPSSGGGGGGSKKKVIIEENKTKETEKIYIPKIEEPEEIEENEDDSISENIEENIIEEDEDSWIEKKIIGIGNKINKSFVYLVEWTKNAYKLFWEKVKGV